MSMTQPVQSAIPAKATKTRVEWLIHFRRAISHETLDHMAERSWESLHAAKDKADMWLAYGDRQQEIDNGVFISRRHR